MNKFSVTISGSPVELPVFGYRTAKGDTYYWRTNNNRVKFFMPDNGGTGDAVIQDWNFYASRPGQYIPIHEPFSLNIGS